MKILVPAIAALGLAFASVPAMAQDAAAPPATDPAAPPAPAPDAATPPAAPMAPPAPDASTAPAAPMAQPGPDASTPPSAPMPMSNPADTAKPEAAPANPPVCGPGVTDRCVQSAGDEKLAARQYSDNLPHNDNAAMRGGGKKPAMKRHRR